MIITKKITEEEFNTVKDGIKTEYNNNKENNIPNFVDFTYYKDGMDGIYIDNVLVGLTQPKDFIKGKTFEIYLFPIYRDENTKEITSEWVLKHYGLKYPECQNFYMNLFLSEPDRHIYKNTGWQLTHEFDELMMEEGADMFIVYTKPNPFYSLKENQGIKLEKRFK